jgi:hypothetical protein
MFLRGQAQKTFDRADGDGRLGQNQSEMRLLHRVDYFVNSKQQFTILREYLLVLAIRVE